MMLRVRSLLVKAELKEANKTAADAGKQVANLEGQLAVYKSLDASKKIMAMTALLNK